MISPLASKLRVPEPNGITDQSLKMNKYQDFAILKIKPRHVERVFFIVTLTDKGLSLSRFMSNQLYLLGLSAPKPT